MNKVFMLGYYQGVVETAPKILSAEKTNELAIAMTIQHLRHAGVDSASINHFLVDDAHADVREVSRCITLNADELETLQAKILRMGQSA